MTVFTFVHVLISLVAIAAGFAVVAGLLKSDRMDRTTAVYLFFTAATDVTGFLLPFKGLTPAVTLDIVSSIVLIACLAARYPFAMRGPWRPAYAVSAVILLYLNVFVLIVQSFQKIAPLHALAPTGSEPPFAIAQGVALIAFIITGTLAAMRFRPR